LGLHETARFQHLHANCLVAGLAGSVKIARIGNVILKNAVHPCKATTKRFNKAPKGAHQL